MIAPVTDLSSIRYYSDVHLHRSRLCKSSKHGNSEFKIAKKKKKSSKIKTKCVIEEIVSGNHDWKFVVEITDVKLIRACVSCMGGGGVVRLY